MTKKGLTYYQADTDRFQDIRIKRLKKRYGCEGYAVFQYVQNEIYRVEGSFICFDEDQAFDCAEYWNISEELVIDIVDYCAEINLFDRNFWTSRRILTSQAIQQRYIEICRRAKKRIAVPDDITLIAEKAVEMPKPATITAQTAEIQQPQNSADFRGNPQTSDGISDKEKKNKINPPSDSPQRGETQRRNVQDLLSGLNRKFDATCQHSQLDERGKAPIPPELDNGKGRNPDGLMYNLEKYHVPRHEAEEILLLTRYGEIGHPIWALFQEIDRSRGKITMPGRFLLSRLRPS